MGERGKGHQETWTKPKGGRNEVGGGDGWVEGRGRGKMEIMALERQ